MKTNKEIIKEFRKEFRPEYTGGGSIKNIIAYGKKLKSVKVDLSDVESFILQALDQKEREVREEINSNSKYLESIPSVKGGVLVLKGSRLPIDVVLRTIYVGDDLKKCYPAFYEYMDNLKSKQPKE